MQIIKNNMKTIIIYSLLILVSIAAYIFTANNYEYYKEPIAVITEEESIYQNSETVISGHKENIYKQNIKAKILNGSHKGEIITIENEYHQGEAYDQKYNVNDEVFVQLNEREGEIVKTHIKDYKRDKYILLLIITIILTITIVGQLKGLLSIVSVIFNIIIFYLLIKINATGISLPLLSYLGAIVFSTICLTLVSGFNKKTLAAIVSTIIGLTITTLIVLAVIHFTKFNGVRFEQMDLLTRPIEGIFISEIILGGLGAIMDISISISSALNELIEKDKKITKKELKKSGFNIGQDIMSTMINVLFFIYLSTAIPNLAIYFRNGIKINALITEFINLEMTRALTGAIGIVLTIPIAVYISLLFYKRRSAK